MRRSRVRCACGLLLALAAGSIAAAQPAATPPLLRVGLATAKINPDESVSMDGFAARKGKSTGSFGDLTSTMIVFDNGATRLGIMANDILGTPRAVVDDIRSAAEQAGIAPQNMMINNSHTHSGPTFDPRSSYPRIFKEQTCALPAAAVADLQPAILDYVVGTSTMGINRRKLNADGKYAGMAPTATKPIDMDVPVLRVLTPEGKVRGLVFGYACHPSTLSGLLISPDYVGPARDYLAQAFPDATPAFLQGCGGDVKTRAIDARGRFGYVGKDLDNCTELGHELARAAVAGLCCTPHKLGPELGAVSRMVEPPTRKQYTPPWAIEMQAFRIGDLYLIASNGEVCVQIGLHIKRALAGTRVWTCGYSNERHTYIVAAADVPEGGYEVNQSPVTAAAEQFLVDRAVELVEALQAGPIAPMSRGPEQTTGGRTHQWHGPTDQ